MNERGVLSLTLRGLVEAGDAMAMPVDPLLERLGIDRQALADPDHRVSVATVLRFWHAASAGCDQGDFSIAAAEALPDGVYRILEFLASTSPTIVVGMQRIARYLPLVTSMVDIEVLSTGGRHCLRTTMLAPPEMMSQVRPMATFCMAIIQRNAKRQYGNAWRLSAVRVALPRPVAAAQYDAFFGVPVQFDAEFSELELVDAVWAAPVPLSDPTLFAILDGHAESQLNDAESGIVQQTRRALDTATRGGDPRLAGIASQLGMSGRALQRALKEEDTAFSDLQDTARFDAARQYLADTQVSLFEISYLLGFSDQSGFNRAFKRWAGQTPRNWRLAL